MILDQLFEAVGEDSTAQRVADMLRKVHPDPSEATEREILAATSRVLTDQGMRDVQVRFYMRDPDFQSDIIEAVQALLKGISEGLGLRNLRNTLSGIPKTRYAQDQAAQSTGRRPTPQELARRKQAEKDKKKGVSEKIDLGPRLGTKRDQGKILRKMRQSRLGEQGISQGIKVVKSDYDLDQMVLTFDIEGPRKGKPLQFTYWDYDEDFANADRKDVFDQLQQQSWYAGLNHPTKMEILDASYKAIRGEAPSEYKPTVGDIPLDMAEAMKPSDIPPTMRQRLTMKDIEAERPAGAYRFRVTFPDGATADFMDFEAAKQRADADRGRISKLSETQKTVAKATKGTNPRLERILKMLRANHPQAQNDLEALILDFRGQQAMDRRDISRLDAENDAEEEDIARLEKMLAILKQRAKLAEHGSKKKGPGLRVARDEDENITLAEQGKKDACYHKVKSRYKVWPSAYASGALVQCRKQGADNWGTGASKK